MTQPEGHYIIDENMTSPHDVFIDTNNNYGTSTHLGYTHTYRQERGDDMVEDTMIGNRIRVIKEFISIADHQAKVAQSRITSPSICCLSPSRGTHFSNCKETPLQVTYVQAYRLSSVVKIQYASASISL